MLQAAFLPTHRLQSADSPTGLFDGDAASARSNHTPEEFISNKTSLSAKSVFSANTSGWESRNVTEKRDEGEETGNEGRDGGRELLMSFSQAR